MRAHATNLDVCSQLFDDGFLVVLVTARSMQWSKAQSSENLMY